MFHKAVEVHLYRIGSIILLGLLLVACMPETTVTVPATSEVPPMPTQIEVQKPTEVISAPTSTVTASTQAYSETKAGTLTIDISGVAQSTNIETVPAASPSDSTPWFSVLPEYTRVTLEGYSVSSSRYSPQVFVYPTKDLARINEKAGTQLNDLVTLLDSKLAGDQLPFMPLELAANSKEVIHPQIEHLDFKNGQGVRYLTQFGNGLAPINNHGLIYTFQGLTTDGQYYVAAVLPVTFPELPQDSLTPLPTDQAGGIGYMEYLTGMAKTLDKASKSAFTPDLAKLDAMMSSIEVK